LPVFHITDCKMRLYMSFRQPYTPRVPQHRFLVQQCHCFVLRQDLRLPLAKEAPRGRRGAILCLPFCDIEGGAWLEKERSGAAGPWAFFRRDRCRILKIGACVRLTLELLPPWLCGRWNGAEQDVISGERIRRPAGAFRFAPTWHPRLQHRRCAAGSPALSLPPGLLRPWSICPCVRWESFVALAEGLQNACGRSAAPLQPSHLQPVRLLPQTDDARADKRPLRGGCAAHYRMDPTANTRGVAHENGSIEIPTSHLKQAIGPALLLRGSR